MRAADVRPWRRQARRCVTALSALTPLACVLLLAGQASPAGAAAASVRLGSSPFIEGGASPLGAANASLTFSPPPGDCLEAYGSFGVGNWPPACWRPYGPKSPFNTPIPAHPRLAPDSASITRYMRARHWSFGSDHSGNLALEAQGSRPVYWSRPGDPLVKVNCMDGFSSCRRGLRLRIPAGARPEGQSDGHMTVIDQAAGREYDFWRASTPEHGEMSASAASIIPIGVAAGTGLGGTAEASYLGLAAGLIRAPELIAGNIGHALATTVECVQRRDVWPSPADSEGDSVCSHRGAGPHFASLLQLNMSSAEIAATGAPAWQQAVMRAMSEYGIYVVDTNGSGESTEMSLLVEDDKSFTSFGYPGEMASFVQLAGGTDKVAGVPVNVAKLRVIAPCVPRRTC
jgi:hypothetical protein